jgi:pilus assembly protein CpaE
MDDAKLKTAVISANRSFRDAVSRLLRDFPEMLQVVADITAATGGMDGEALEQLHQSDPELIVADFADDPVSSLRYIRLLSDARPSRAFLGAGPELPPELLLEAMRAGVSEYLPMPVEPRQMEEALRRVARKLGRGPTSPNGRGRIIAFVGAKGGTGATTTAVNAAVHARAVAGSRTLLLDLDLELGSAGVLMGVPPRFSILDVIDNLHRLDESLLDSLVTEHESGTHVLPAPAEPTGQSDLSPDDVRTALRLIRHHYQLLVVDVGRPTSPLAKAVLEQADQVYLVLTADVPSLRNAKRLLPRLASPEPQDERVQLVLNRVGDESEITPADVRTALEVPVSFSLRQDDAHVLRSVNIGEPVVMNGSRSRYCADVKELGLAIAQAVNPDAVEQDSGIFKRLREKIGSSGTGSS